jgi:hypothetical protein
MMKKTVTVITILFFMLTSFTYCQIAAGYSTDGNTLALSTNPLKMLWGEIRVNTKEYNQASWSYSDRGITQAYMMVRIFSSKNVSIYTGAGAGINLLSKGNDKWVSGNVPVGIRIIPFKSLPNLFLTGEYDPMIIIADDVPIIHSVSLGFRYRLSKEE